MRTGTWKTTRPSSFRSEREKAALNGIAVEQIALTLRIAVGGMKVGLLHAPKEKEDVPIFLRLPKSERSSVQDLKILKSWETRKFSFPWENWCPSGRRPRTRASPTRTSCPWFM